MFNPLRYIVGPAFSELEVENSVDQVWSELYKDGQIWLDICKASIQSSKSTVDSIKIADVCLAEYKKRFDEDGNLIENNEYEK